MVTDRIFRRNLVGGALVIGNALFLFFLLWRYAVNFPNSDDYFAFLNFLNQFNAATTLGQKFALLLSPHNEHYMVFNRLLAIDSWSVFGTVDFRAIIFTGYIALIGAALLLYQNFNVPRELKPFLFLPAGLLFFNARYVEAVMWATTAVTMCWTLPLALLAFTFARKDSWKTDLAAVVFCVATTFTQGNGVLTFFVCALIALWEERFFTALIEFVVFVALMIFLFGEHVTAATPGILQIVNYGIAFLGSAVGFENLSACWIAGMLQIVGIAYLAFKRYHRNNPVIAGWIIFLFLTAMINGAARAEYGPLFACTQSRYTLISTLEISALLMAFIEILPVEKILRGAVNAASAASLCFVLFTYWVGVDQFRFRWELLHDSQVLWELTGHGLQLPIEGMAEPILRTAIANGFFENPPLQTANFTSQEILQPPAPRNAKLPYRIESLFAGDKFIVLSGWLNPKDHTADDTLVVLNSESGSKYYSSARRVRPDLAQPFNRKTRDVVGFFSVIPKDELSPGAYRIGFATAGQNGGALQYSDTTIYVDKGYAVRVMHG